MRHKERVARLEQGLRLWEDLCFLMKTYSDSLPYFGFKKPLNTNAGPLLYASELRNHLMRSIDNYFDYSRFTGSIEMWGQLMHVGSLPQDLFSWCRNSRRIFQIPTNLQTILSATSLEGIFWEDVVWPFRSFGLALEEPLIDEHKNKFDFILVSNIGGCTPELEGIESVSFTIFSEKLDEYQPLTEERRAEIIKLIKKRGMEYMNKLQKKILFMGQGYMDSFFTTFKGKNGKNLEPVTRPLEEGFKDFHQRMKTLGQQIGVDLAIEDEATDDPFRQYSILEKARHLSISFCLYLATIPSFYHPGSDKNWKTIDSGKINNVKPVTHHSQLCTINFKNNLTKDDHAVASLIRESRSGSTKCPHFRRGHFRKRSGEGDNPHALKCIMVRPALIGRDRLQSGALPTGAKTVMQ